MKKIINTKRTYEVNCFCGCDYETSEWVFKTRKKDGMSYIKKIDYCPECNRENEVLEHKRL